MRESRGISLPWRRSPRAAWSSPLTLFVAAVTALLSCFLATSAVLIAAASGGAAMDYLAGNACPDQYGPVVSKAAISPAKVPAVLDTVQRQAAAHGFPQPVAGMYAGPFLPVSFGDSGGHKVTLGYRDDAVAHLDNVRNTGRAGLLVGDGLTKLAPVAPGDSVQYRWAALPAVTGVYHDLSVPPPRWWCSQQNSATIYAYANDPVQTVMMATDRQTFLDAARAVHLTGVSLTAGFYLGTPRTTEQARDDLDRSKALISGIQADLARQGLGDAVSMQLPFEHSVQLAEEAESHVLVSILPLAAISVLVGCGGIVTVALQWYQRRYPALRLLAARGASPPALGGLAVAELGLPVLVGGVVGIVVARFTTGMYAPPGQIASGPQIRAVLVAAGVLVFCLVVLGAVAGWRAHREFQVGRRARASGRWRWLVFFPWELLTAATAYLGWSRLSGYGTSKLGTPLAQVDPLALTYPVFVVLTAGLLVARIAWLLLRASHRVRVWSKPSLQLAIRRLASARAPVVGVLVVGVLAIGTLAAGSGIASGQRTALDTKSGILVGATTRVDVETSLGLGRAPMPEALRDTSSLIGQTTGTGSVVLVVDPETLTRTAYLGSLRDDVEALLPKLAHPVAGGIPAIRIAHGSTQSTALPGLPPAVVVGDLPWFPVLGENIGYVVSRDALTPAQLDTIPRWTLLSSSSLEQVSAALGAQGQTLTNRATQATALDALPFYVVEWTFSFVTVLGGVLGVVAVLGLFVAVEVRRRQNALAGALVLRMGLGVRALFGSHVLELGALAGLAVLAGIGCGVGVAAVAVPRFDPVRWLAPGSVLPDQTAFVLAVLAAGVLVVLLAASIAVRSVRTARTAELLRG
ncbi:ABC transporter permease [Amycolatopsis acidicola]|uniref:ABC transporter permease n=1 Tax=Amycolatopsis acidicola TaxID=2596893 RepID=A0A5N0VJH8_9PSEU|nr:ABC transporter permease [Amycolatopsis acidicola]KAA9166365.1 ABC transporter permease [Amycolatopsis acidicola]